MVPLKDCTIDITTKYVYDAIQVNVELNKHATKRPRRTKRLH